jgi:hypothetical protein
VCLTSLSNLLFPLLTEIADGIDLFIWGNAETTVTIIAASIPILRVLIRDVKTSRRSDTNTKYSKSEFPSEASQRNKVTVSGGSAGGLGRGSQDDGSEKGMIGEQLELAGILRTNDVSVEYHRKRDVESDEDEMYMV